jgi:hypothetical protein
MFSFFSKTVLDSKKEILVMKIPTNWTEEYLLTQLDSLAQLTVDAAELDIAGVEFHGKKVTLNRLTTVHILFKFLGIVYRIKTLDLREIT